MQARCFLLSPSTMQLLTMSFICTLIVSSIGTGATFSPPPVTMISFWRPPMNRNPSSSNLWMSRLVTLGQERSSPSKVTRVNPTFWIDQLCRFCFVPKVTHAAIAAPRIKKTNLGTTCYIKLFLITPGDNFAKPSFWIRVLYIHLPCVISSASGQN